RATYYRWAQQFPLVCPAEAKAPSMPIVGDLHLENFGTWRDGEARLAWGVNDFDEVHRGAYANDLVRLATSVLIAVDEGSLYVGARRATSEILSGYTLAMAAKAGQPFVLEEFNTELRDIALSDARSPKKFWKKILAERDATPPAEAKALLERSLPKGDAGIAFKRRIAGVGSLGLERHVATRTVDGSAVAREAKRRAPASHAWAIGKAHEPTLANALLAHAIRPDDPFLHFSADWIVRRLAPDCQNVALADIADAAERRTVLGAMGRETANIHRGNRGARLRIRAHLDRQKDGWLFEAASRMADSVRKDWKVLKKRG
ncbi:MAG TPA: DUF2252 family protein, partial [Rhizomicrobium sp.]|nr:DUF2252 family protein [Rhizomicrobium sp.]